MAIIQILSNEAQNSKGFHVINDSIDWKRFKKNPVLKYNDRDQEHYGVNIGRVENIRLVDGKWVGELVFGPSELAQKAKADYEAGILNAVSIFGPAKIVERRGRRVTTYFEVWEISLVGIPSNPDTVAIRDSKEGLSVDFSFKEIEELEVVGLSAKDENIINQFIDSMTEEQKPDEKKDSGLIMQFLSVAKSFLSKIGKAELDKFMQAESATGDEHVEGSLNTALSANLNDTSKEKGEETITSENAVKENPEDKPKEELSAGETKVEEPLRKEETKEEPVKPTGLSVSEDAKIFKSDKETKIERKMPMPFSNYISDPANASKIQKVIGLSAITDNEDPLAPVALSAETKESIDALQELCASMSTDKRFMSIAENITFDVNGGKQTPASETIQGLASGALSSQFLQNADLAKIVWTGEFVRQLLPNDSWASRVRRVSVRDRQGVIWIESAMNPEIYFGDRAPVNAMNYLYDDLPRALNSKVIAIQPTLWQTSNTQILAYNDFATGQSEMFRILSTAAHNYWLQSIAEQIPATNHIAMSGEVFDSANRFPINPNAAGNLYGLSIGDIIDVQGSFLSRNLGFTNGDGVMVLATPYFSAFKKSPEIQTILTRELGQTRPDLVNYGGFNITNRSIIAAYNTATNTVVDAELYYDKPVAPVTGAIDDTHDRPVLAATVYDIGLAFVPEEVIVGIGNINVHMVSDPNSYGYKVSADFRTGATIRRSSGVGVALLRPTVAP